MIRSKNERLTESRWPIVGTYLAEPHLRLSAPSGQRAKNPIDQVAWKLVDISAGVSS